MYSHVEKIPQSTVISSAINISSLSVAGRDFVFGAFSLSFSPTATAPTSLPVSVMILEDEVVEATEELVVVLSVPQGEGGVALLQNNSTVVILDEDGRHLYVDSTVVSSPDPPYDKRRHQSRLLLMSVLTSKPLEVFHSGYNPHCGFSAGKLNWL